MKTKKLLSIVLASALAVSGYTGIAAAPAKAAAVAVQAPKNLRVPALAYDENSITLVWDKPDDYANVEGYNVYMNGVKIETAEENTKRTSAAKPYIDKFYATADNGNQVKVKMHNFTATGLEPNTTYTFYVTAVDGMGNESAPSNTVTQSTTPVPQVFNIVDFGAVGDGTTLNTNAIQAAIDAATPGSKVLVPAGVFKTGAIWLKSDMTFEVAEGARLLGSENPDDYPFYYYHYDYMVTPRYYSLINAYTPDYGTLRNIRIVGKGVIDGNGWIWPSGKEFVPEPSGGYADDQFPNQTVLNKGKPVGSTSDPSSTGYWRNTGVLAKNQTAKAIEMGWVDNSYDPTSSAANQRNYENPAYSTRSNLILMKGVENVYYGGFTAINPANHTLVNSEDKNVVVNGVKILTYDDNNADGIEFIHSDGLTVFNTVFDTGDDCMNFAAGQGAAGQKYEPAQNAWIFNNYFREGHGGVVAGSHTAAWIQNILAEDNVMYHTDVGLRMKTNSRIGGGAQNIVFRDTAIKDASSQAFIFTSSYDDANGSLDYEPAAASSEFRNVTVKNVTVDTTPVGIQVQGVDGGYHHDIHFDNVKFWSATTPTNISYMKDSSFNDVVFDGSANPWKIAYSSGLTFTGTTTRGTSATAADKDQTSAPVWSASSFLKDKDTVTGDTYVNLTWGGASDNVAVSGYLIAKNGQLINAKNSSGNYVPVTGSTYKADKLSPGLNYHFQIFAVDATGNVTAGPSADIVTSGAKDTVPPVVAADSAIKLNGKVNTTWLNIYWTGAVDAYGVDHYNIYQDDQKVGTVTGSTYFNATGLSFSTTYKFDVEAVDAAGNATRYPTSLTVKTADAYDASAPKWSAASHVTASDVTETSVKLAWTAATDDLGVVGYRIYQNGKPLEGDVKFTPVNAAKTVTGTAYTVSGLKPNTTYTFKVEAGDVVSKWTGSGPSVSVTTLDTTAPVWAPGSAITVSAVGQSSVTLSWPAATDNAAVKGYKVYKGTTEIASLPSETRTYTATGLSDFTSYTFKVEATDEAGNQTTNGPSVKVTTNGRERDSDRGAGGSAPSTAATPTPAPAATPAPASSASPSTGATGVSSSPSADTSKRFVDVNENYAWAQKAIETLAEKGIITGTSDTTFDPDKNIKRADFITLLVRAMNLKADVTSNFDDVGKNDYYYEAIGIAKQLGIASGTGDNKFNPQEEITRQDMMVLLSRALQITKKLDVSADRSELEKFSDKSGIASYAADSVAALVKSGIIEGSGSRLNPLDHATRAETAVILFRILNKQ